MYCQGLRMCIYILHTLFKYFLWYEIFNEKEVSKPVSVHGLVYGISHFHTKMPGKSLFQKPRLCTFNQKESFTSITRAHYFHVLYPFRDCLKKINVPYQKTHFLILNLFMQKGNPSQIYCYWPHIQIFFFLFHHKSLHRF